jgi:hypothetical protein
MFLRARAALACLALLTAPALAGCGDDPSREKDQPAATDWTPAPDKVDGLSVLAASDKDGFRLHTASGDKTFLPGVNLGSTTPLHQPGEVGTIEAAHYQRWFDEMGELGIRVVRIYTLHPPAFYDELAAYNEAHADAPLYLVQGAYLPNEEYNQPGRSLYDADVDGAFRAEIKDLSDAVHGDLVRKPAPGMAGGTYGTDVSEWLLSWIIGVEWDPPGVLQTDTAEKDRPYEPGTYFAATDDASPTERWIATHMDDVAALEAKRGTSVPVAMANWPTADPLSHPDEPLAREDLTGVDANHVLPTDAWPGGTFASFHAYPYYPDFQRYEPGLQDEQWNGTKDAYAGYLMALQEHFAPHMPLLVTEFGVPSSLGSAHNGTNGRDQGAHSEQEAIAMDADMMRMMEDKGLGGAFVFSWTDEWFKRTWNTMEHQDPERRQLWHDPLTNEQWFGLVATDPDPVADAAVEAMPKTGAYEYLYAWADASYVHLDVKMRDALPSTLVLDADVVPGPDRADYRVTVDLAADTARLDVRRELDPIRLDTPKRPYRPDQADDWHLYRLITNQEYDHNGHHYPAEYQDVGDLVEGSWDPAAKDVDSMSTWHVDEARRTVSLRIPWSMLGFADPSSHLALGEGTPAERVISDGIGFDLDADGATGRLDFVWPDWNNTGYRERPKTGLDVLADTYRDLAP